MRLWFWCVPRRGVLRAVRVVIRPRHTTYEEARVPPVHVLERPVGCVSRGGVRWIMVC
jgi:hypothetical protein